MQKINCINGSAVVMLLIVEPWAEQYLIEPGRSVDVVGQGGRIDEGFEVEYFNEGIIVYGWEGSVVSVFSNGEMVEPSAQV